VRVEHEGDDVGSECCARCAWVLDGSIHGNCGSRDTPNQGENRSFYAGHVDHKIAWMEAAERMARRLLISTNETGSSSCMTTQKQV
jgi:hypothetical protein